MSYNTVEEANTYIDTHYLQTDKEYLYWSDLDDASKTVLLTRAFEKIERLPFVGRVCDVTQTTCFPRYINQSVVSVDAIKPAELMEALSIGGAIPNQKPKGLKSFTIGHVSETYSTSSSSSSDPLTAICDDAVRVLLSCLIGGYDICRY